MCMYKWPRPTCDRKSGLTIHIRHMDTVKALDEVQTFWLKRKLECFINDKDV